MPAGRPFMFEDARKLEAMIEDYFAYCDKGREVEYINKSGNVVKCIEPIPYTVEGLARYLGCSVMAIRIKGKTDEIAATLSRARARIVENSIAGGLTNRYNAKIVQLQVQSIDQSYIPNQVHEHRIETLEDRLQRLASGTESPQITGPEVTQLPENASFEAQSVINDQAPCLVENNQDE